MKKILFVVLGLSMLASCQKEMKTGFIEYNDVINDYQKKKDIEKDFDAKKDAYTKKVDSIRNLFQEQANLLQTKDPKMTQKSSQEQYQALGQQFQMFQQQWQTEEQQLALEGQTKIDTLIKEVRTFVKDYGKKNGYTFILGSNEAGSVMYGEESKDLTKAILEELNKSYKKD